MATNSPPKYPVQVQGVYFSPSAQFYWSEIFGCICFSYEQSIEYTLPNLETY